MSRIAPITGNDSVAPVLGVAGSAEAVAHSRSPRMMQAAFESVGATGFYVPLAIRPSSAAKALRALPRLGFRGCNVTMPFKPIAASVATSSSSAVQMSGVANTLCVLENGGLHAESFDGQAVMQACQARGVALQRSSLLLVGSGAVARDIACAGIREGVSHIAIWNRTSAKAHELKRFLQTVAPALTLQVYEQLPIDLVVDLCVSCIPATAQGEIEQINGIQASIIVDVAYASSQQKTQVTKAAEMSNTMNIDGIEILARQGAMAFECWFQQSPSIEKMIRAAR